MSCRLRLRTALLPVLVLVSLLCALFAAGASAEEKIPPNKSDRGVLYDDVCKRVKGFQDLTATVTVEYKNDDVLAKMGKRYAQQYELKKALVRFKNPDKTRLEGSLGVLKFVYITNPDFSIIKVRPIGYERKQRISDRPSHCRSGVDLGLITKDLWDDYVVEDKGLQKDGTEPRHVLDLMRSTDNSNLYRVWIDPTTLRLMKTEKFNHEKTKLLQYYVFSEPEQFDGVWIPTKIEMYSADGELAAVTKASDIKLNTDLPDSLFK